MALRANAKTCAAGENLPLCGKHTSANVDVTVANTEPMGIMQDVFGFQPGQDGPVCQRKDAAPAISGRGHWSESSIAHHFEKWFSPNEIKGLEQIRPLPSQRFDLTLCKRFSYPEKGVQRGERICKASDEPQDRKTEQRKIKGPSAPAPAKPSRRHISPSGEHLCHPRKPTHSYPL